MADSDNTTTLPLVTHRRAVVGMASAIARSIRNSFAGRDPNRRQQTGPAEALWWKWQDAYEEAQRLCRQQQCLERKLIETVGLPCASVQSSDGEKAACQARWDTADCEIGYSATLQAEREAAGRAADLLEMLSRTPAKSLPEVAAKLDAILREGQPSQDDPEFPWPQIRSVLEDIVRIDQQMGLGTQA
ncbi:hypothetical protein FJW06_23575 [Mesorhizobium sp. B4-1-3]|uniref:hypothetical protein n=1 Tax=Mesorhizobium sp. B4-1-3 TaxID=2589889 RepID=UPI00112AF181|nr:hypothetical protein [Mesorhizobium sp. B4-1-3]TPI10327.1 hypothetical protein FJW06_23575 [Mesorhizobium sp. B4-1-3]